MQKPRKIQTVHVEQLENELCVYDLERKVVHNLNSTATLVWEQCDGQTEPAEIAAKVEADLGTPYGEDLVWMTLNELEQAHLLENEVVQPADRSLMSRRTMLKQMGVAAALAPVVVSIVAPSPAQAQTPDGDDIDLEAGWTAVGGACVTNGDLTEAAIRAAAPCPDILVVEVTAATVCALCEDAADGGFYRFGTADGQADRCFVCLD